METNHIVGIEKAILASILFDPDIFEDILSLIDSKDFFYPPHRVIFDILKTLNSKKMPLDEEFIRKQLGSNSSFDSDELLVILATNPIVNIQAYTQEIKNESIKRELHSLALQIAQESSQVDKSSEEVLDEIEKKIYAISTSNTFGDFKDSEHITTNTMKLLEELKARGNQIVTGLNTGFRELNRLTTGFNKGELIIIGARPSMGKTTFVLNLAQNILNTGKGVAVFSLEMQAEHLMLRMLSSISSIPLQNLKVANLTDQEWSDLTIHSDDMAQRSFFVDDGSHLTITQLRSKLRRLKSRNPEVEIAIVDYLQLMASSKRSGGEKRHEEISEISRGLKILARELQMPIIALSQLNRLVESRDDKRPILSDLRESGAIEQDADVIMFLYRDDVYARRLEKEKEAAAKKEGKKFESNFREREIEPAEVIIAKNRNGETSTVKIQFNKKFTRFEDKTLENEMEYQPTKIEGYSAVSNKVPLDMPLH